MSQIAEIIKLHEIGYTKDEITKLLAGEAIDAPANNNDTVVTPPTVKPSEDKKPTEGATDNTEVKKPETPDYTEFIKAVNDLKTVIQASNRNNDTDNSDGNPPKENVTDILSKMFR